MTKLKTAEYYEIFYHLFKILPNNVFDIQIAAGILGLGKALSYSNLCDKICNVTIDKTYQKADWLKRPLNSAMLQYAIIDVEYLESLYIYLQSMIDDQKLDDIYQNQIYKLLKPENYKVNCHDAWKKVRFPERSEYFINKMKILAAFRESSASIINIPKKHLISDDDLVEICRYLPITTQELTKLKINSILLSKKKYKDELLDLCLGLRE